MRPHIRIRPSYLIWAVLYVSALILFERLVPHHTVIAFVLAYSVGALSEYLWRDTDQ